MEKEKIKIEAILNVPANKAWDYYTSPDHITQWNFASDDWCCPNAENDLQVGGKYKARMEAKDGSMGFDFEATYEEIIPEKKIQYAIADGRQVITEFEEAEGQTRVTTIFEAENQNSVDLQRDGWQAILNNYKDYTENSSK